MNAYRVAVLTSIGLLSLAAYRIGLEFAPQADPLVVPTESRADCLELRLVPDDAGDGLLVRAYMWDGDGHVVWTRDLRQEEPLATLWDETDLGQYAVDTHFDMAEREVEP